jgi:hypothetical protein
VQEGFSERVVQVGKTTAEDLEWWFRDVMRWRVSRTRDTVEANCVLRDEVADY